MRSDQSDRPAVVKPMRQPWGRLLGVFGLVAVLVGGLVALAGHFGLWALLADVMRALQTLSATAPATTACLYALAFAAMVTLCLPVGPAMSMAGGMLLGVWFGTVMAALAIVLGSIGFFLAARTAFGAAMGQGRSEMLDRIRPQLERDGFAALLALRIAPVMPGWLLGLAAAAAGMRLLPFSGATVLGILPATIVFASTGAGLGQALAQGAAPSLGLLLRPGILLPLLALSLLALLPIVLRRRRI